MTPSLPPALLVHFPYLSGLSKGKSWSDIKGERIWMNGGFDWRFAAHEIGHSYGCWHAHLWVVLDNNPVSPPPPAGTGAADSSGYGDWFDIMGGHIYATDTYDAAMDFNEQYKYQMGWIPGWRVRTLTSSGTYYNLKIYRCDDPNTLASDAKSGVFGVKFSKDATYDYWLGYRTNFNSFTAATPGLYVKWAKKTNAESYLIDWVPSTNNPSTGGYLDAPIPITSPYSRLPDGRIVIKPKARGQDGNGDQWITVDVTLP